LRLSRQEILCHPPAFENQDVANEKMFGKKKFALYPDLGTAKTFMLLRDFFQMWQADLVDDLLIIAPVNVHAQWIDEELPNTTGIECDAFAWPERPRLEKGRKPRVFAIYPEAFRRKTKNGNAAWNFCKKYLQSARVGVVVDECQMLANNSRQTRRIHTFKPLAHYRRVASGFPDAKGLIDYYRQYSWLGTDILDCTTKSQFEDRYVEKGGFRGKQIIGYKNQKDFYKRVAKHTYTVKLDDCIDMPERTWLRFPVDLTQQQRRLVDQVKEEFRAVLDDKNTLNMPMALQRITRIQQIACGFLPLLDDTGRKVVGLRKIPELRTKALESVLEGIKGKVVIWSRFSYCIKRLVEHFGDAAVGYYGGLDKAERADNKQRFQRDPKIKYIFAQGKSAGAGFNGLTVSRHSLYWSNWHGAQLRRQTERRQWRLGQSHAVVYGDFCAKGTYDDKIRNALIRQQDVADALRDNVANWRY
jgi:hypothetical protein